jgi:hypothetical protein
MHGVTPSVVESGAVIQWSADRTEHAHITEIKVPGRSGNNQDYNPQICRWLDRSEKHQNFSLALRLLVPDTDPVNTPDDEDSDDIIQSDGLTPTSSPPDFFSQAIRLAANVSPTTPLPLRTFSTDTTGFRLNRYPDLPSLTVDEAAVKFKLPDLRAALADYVRRMRDLQLSTLTIGQRRLSPADAVLPFSDLQVWHSARVQVRSADPPTDVSTPCRVCAEPPSSEWPFGRYDTVLISNGSTPGRGLQGKSISRYDAPTLMLFQGFDLAQVWLIFHPVWSSNVYLSYMERFDIIPQATNLSGTSRACCPDPITGMYVVKRSHRSNGSRMGDIIPLSQIRTAAPLVPRYGSQADPKLTSRNSMEFSTEFFLNNFFDKDIYYMMLQNDL